MSIRTERVARLVQREVADILNTTFQDYTQQMATVTYARVNRDLSIAYIYISCLGEEASERASAFKHLEEIIPKVRGQLASRIRHQLRRIPELRFIHDDSLNHAARIDELLGIAREERAGRDTDEPSE